MYNESEDAYYIRNAGADSVPKKLGSPTPDMYLWTSSPVDIKALMPDIYSQLTTADFFVGSRGAQAFDESGSANVSGGYFSGECSISYTPSTGMLSFGGYNNRGGNSQNYHYIYSTGTVFCVYRGTIAGVSQ